MWREATIISFLLVLSGVSATTDLSNFIFKPNFGADESLLEHARTAAAASSINKYHTEDTTVDTGADLCDPEYFAELFAPMTFPPEDYTRYKGLDHTALFASSVTLSNKYAVIGSNGYNAFRGIVHVYVPKTATKWSLQALIRSPVWNNANFGNDVSVDNERMVVAANAYQKYDGIVFVYTHNPEHECWLLTGTIKSPLGDNNNTVYQGFGYRVDMSGDFLIVGTSVNNAYIYREVSPGNWSMHTALPPPAPGSYFGRAVAIEGDYAMVGAYGYGGSVGRVYVYKYDNVSDSWDAFSTLTAPRNHSNFGFSVDMHGTNLIVGANGFVANQFDNKVEFDARNTQQSQNQGWAYVYMLTPNASDYRLDVELVSPVGNNSYFGVGVGIYGDAVIVGADGFPCHGLTGAGFVFYRNPNSGNWTLNQSYPSPAGYEGHFGYAVDIAANYSVIGAYGFDDLRGAVYLADRTPPVVIPPTWSPTAEPTASPTNPTEILSGGGLNRQVGGSKLTLGMILALALAVLILAAATGLICYCCCCMVPIIPLLKKKKKKEEEESPYTVHSYAGYIEEDEYIPPVVLLDEEIKKKEKNVKFMEDGSVRKMFPYKVYGPRGYSEGNNEVVPDELLEQKKEQSMSSVYDPSDENSHFEYENDLVTQKISGEAESREQGNIHQIHIDHARRNLQNYREEQSNYSTLTGPSTILSSHASSISSMQGDEFDDDDSVATGFTEVTGRSQNSLVEQAKAKYSRISREHITTTHSTSIYENSSSNLVSAAKAKYANMSRSRSSQDEGSVLTGSTGSSGQSYVDAAKVRYANMKRSGSASSKEASESELSLVERTKLRYASLRAESNMSTTESEVAPVRVLAAREKYEMMQASSMDDHDDDDETVMSTATSQQSAVEQARAKYAKLRRNREAAGLGSSSNSSQTGVSQTEGSLVDSIKARYTSMRSAEESSAGFVAAAKANYANMSGDDVSVVSGSTQASSQSLVEAAKAKYANLKKSRDDASSTSSAPEPSSVDVAKANYMRWKETNKSSTKQTATSTSNFTSSSMVQTTSNKSAEQVQVQHSSKSETSNTVEDSTSSKSVVTNDHDSLTEASDSPSKVDATRKAAMAKFALYKAKAEAEAKARSMEEDTTVQTMLKERNVIARKPAVVEVKDTSIEDSVEAARLRTERLLIDANAAAATSTISDEAAEQQRLQEREAAKQRAQAKARENFARLKARTEAQSTGAKVSAENDQLRSAVDEARAKLQRSAAVLAEAVPTTDVVAPTTTTSHKTSTTSTSMRSSAVSHKVESTSTHSREVTASSSAKSNGIEEK